MVFELGIDETQLNLKGGCYYEDFTHCTCGRKMAANC